MLAPMPNPIAITIRAVNTRLRHMLRIANDQ